MSVAQVPAWAINKLPTIDRAACADSPEPLWDDWIDGETRAQRADRHYLALAVCERCPVQNRCATMRERIRASGVWGGQLFQDSTHGEGVRAA